ncbi:hypothetical protein ACRCUN_17105 [Mycobacterium sp. LTG2003]
MTDTHDYDDIPGARAAARAIVAREYAWRRIAAEYDDTPRPVWIRETSDAEAHEIRRQAVRAVDRGAQYAGLTLAELDAAELEIRRLFVDDGGRSYLLDVARHHLALLQLPPPDGPGPDAEDYRRDDGIPLR